MILMVVAGFFTLFSFVVIVTHGISYHLLLVEMAIFGGFLFAFYPVAVARANDVFEGKDAVGVSSALLLCYSIGAISGPIFSSIIMMLLNSPYGLFSYWSLVGGAFAVFAVLLKHKEKIAIIRPVDQVNFVPMKKTSFVAMTLDPRTDADEDQ
jgi:MFS family permease